MADPRLNLVENEVVVGTEQKFNLSSTAIILGDKKIGKQNAGKTFMPEIPVIQFDDQKNGTGIAPKVRKERRFNIHVTCNADPSQTEVLTLIVKPVELHWEVVDYIYADSGELDLCIEGWYDPKGLDNYKSVIKSPMPHLGELKEGGLYKPPKFVECEKLIEIEATSLYDESKKLSIKFNVRPPKCPNFDACGQIVQVDGRCPVCGDTKHTIKVPTECPNPECKLSGGWDGRTCRWCGYPWRKKKRI